MRGTQEIHGFQAQEVVRAYRHAVEKGETTHAENIRWAHPDLNAEFNAVDKEGKAAVFSA